MTKEEKDLKVRQQSHGEEKGRQGALGPFTAPTQSAPSPRPHHTLEQVQGSTPSPAPPQKDIEKMPHLPPASLELGSAEPPQPQEPLTNGPTRPTNKCCLCWCCCCSCSCSGLRTNQQNRAKAKESESDPSCDVEVTPSLEEIRSWGESFEKLMRSSGGRKVFRDFLKCEYSEENILFWLACEELRKERKPELVEEKARLIYEDYISILSPKEVSLDSRVREVVNQNMVDPSPHTFDEAQVQIYTLMHRDSYPRFVNSIMYKKLAQLNPPHRGSSVSTSGLRSNPTSRKESLAA